MRTRLANPTPSFPILLPPSSLVSTNEWAGFKGTAGLNNRLGAVLMSSCSAVASETPGTDREIAALADQFQQLRPEVLNTLSESLQERSWS